MRAATAGRSAPLDVFGRIASELSLTHEVPSEAADCGESARRTGSLQADALEVSR